MIDRSTPSVVALADLMDVWGPASSTAYNLRDRATSKVEHTATRADMKSGSNSILRS